MQGSVKGKDVKIIINPRFYFTDTQQIWNCYIYESAVSITSPLKTITNPLKEIKMVKTDPKKGSKPNFLFARSSRYNCPTFWEKKNSHFTIPLKGWHTKNSGPITKVAPPPTSGSFMIVKNELNFFQWVVDSSTAMIHVILIIF